MRFLLIFTLLSFTFAFFDSRSNGRQCYLGIDKHLSQGSKFMNLTEYVNRPLIKINHDCPTSGSCIYPIGTTLFSINATRFEFIFSPCEKIKCQHDDKKSHGCVALKGNILYNNTDSGLTLAGLSRSIVDSVMDDATVEIRYKEGIPGEREFVIHLATRLCDLAKNALVDSSNPLYKFELKADLVGSLERDPTSAITGEIGNPVVSVNSAEENYGSIKILYYFKDANATLLPYSPLAPGGAMGLKIMIN